MPDSFTMSNQLGDVLLHEAPDYRSRELLTVLAGDGADRVLGVGEVIGKITHGAVTEDHAGNTGDGAMGAITLGPLAQVGDYLLTCVTAAADGGVFHVVSPAGYRLADLTVGVAYAGDHLNMTLADGDADFVVGDKFTISIAPGSGKVKALDPDAKDGSQNAAGFMGQAVTAPNGEDAPNKIGFTSDAIVKLGGLVWPDGITSDQKTAALAQLKALGIYSRGEV